MRKTILLVVVFVIALFSTNNIFAQKGKMHFEKLNLTELQKEQIKKIRFANEEAKIEIGSKLRKNRLEIKKLLTSDNLSESALLELVENGNNLKAENEKNRIKMWFNIYNILDKTQKETWKEKFNNFIKSHSSFRKGKRHYAKRDFCKRSR